MEGEIEPGSVNTEKGKVGTLGEIHEKSVVLKEQSVSCEVFGSYDGFRQKAKSKVIKTCFAAPLAAMGFDLVHGAPDMSYAASNRHFLSLPSNDQYRHPTIFRIVSKVFLEYVLRNLDPRYATECHIIDQQTSINGQDGVRYVDAINLRSSVGHPYCESKKLHMHTKTGDWQDERFVNEEIQIEIDRIWECYTSGKSANPISKASLKDEARKKKKILEKNTRVFFAGNLPFTIVQRQLFLWFVRLVQKNPYLFMMAPGIDAASRQWDQLSKFLFSFSPLAIAGDYAGFDTSMSGEELHFAYDFILSLAENLGATSDHVNMMRCCSEDVIHVLVDYFGTLVRMNCNPSGHALTVIINGLVNILRTMVLFVLAEAEDENDYERTARRFFDCVHLMTYGDDNIMTVKNTKRFSHTFMQNEFAKMGIVYTMAEKEAKSEPFIDMSRCSFLKRGFRFEPELECVVAPLEEASLIKTLSIYIPSKVESEYQQLGQSLQNVHREAFLHGHEFFDKWDQILKTLVAGTQWSDMEFPTWDGYCTWFDEKDDVRQQAETVCIRCGHKCTLINFRDDDDVRKCGFCKRCRFDESDLDCLSCGHDDTCKQCGSLLSLKPVCFVEIHQVRSQIIQCTCSECGWVANAMVSKHFLPEPVVRRPNGLGRDG